MAEKPSWRRIVIWSTVWFLVGFILAVAIGRTVRVDNDGPAMRFLSKWHITHDSEMEQFGDDTLFVGSEKEVVGVTVDRDLSTGQLKSIGIVKIKPAASIVTVDINKNGTGYSLSYFEGSSGKYGEEKFSGSDSKPIWLDRGGSGQFDEKLYFSGHRHDIKLGDEWVQGKGMGGGIVKTDRGIYKYDDDKRMWVSVVEAVSSTRP